MGAHFAQLLTSADAPAPQWVVHAYLKLADLPQGKRPPRTIVGMTWGVDQFNAQTQHLQDAILKEMQLDGLLGGVDAT
jgi:hypothetical protein